MVTNFAACLYGISLVLSSASLAGTVRLFDEAEVKANPEKDEMRDGAPPVDFGCQHKIGAKQRHRHLSKVEIELTSRTDEERAGQKLAKLPASPCEIECRQAEEDNCDEGKT